MMKEESEEEREEREMSYNRSETPESQSNGPPLKKKAKRDPKDDQSDSDSDEDSAGQSDTDQDQSKPAAASKPNKRKQEGRDDDPPQRPASRGTYPKPKNFAERMMNVLENSAYTEIIKWQGDDDLIAINTKAIKTSRMLNTNFQGIQYTAFIRNLSRWGFRKVGKLEKAAGFMGYRNSLFQRDNPHLVRHMKIDSDVQDIFGQHQRLAAGQGDAEQAANAPTPTPQSRGGGSSSNEGSLNIFRQMVEQQIGQQPPQNQQQFQHSSQQQQQQGQSLSQQQQLQLLLLQQQQGQQHQTSEGTEEKTAEELLGEIVDLSQRYLRIVPNNMSPVGDSINSLLQLLVTLGSSQLTLFAQERSQRPDPPSNPVPDPSQQQRQNMSPVPQQPQPPVQQQPATMQDLLALVEQSGPRAAASQASGFQGQLPESQQLPDLARLLAQQGAPSAGGGLPPQLAVQLSQQQQMQQHQQQNQQQLQELQQRLQQLQNQQQQQGGGGNQDSPPGNDCRQQ